MRQRQPSAATVNRREAIGSIMTGGMALVTLPGESLVWPEGMGGRMTIVCIIRYEIDPNQRDAFKEYAENWGRIIPRCGGHLVGYFLPYEGTNYVGWGLIAFDSLASYEKYKARLKADPEATANFLKAQSRRVILHEERNFVEVVDGTFGIPPSLAGR